MPNRNCFIFLGSPDDHQWLQPDEIVGWTTHKDARLDDLIFFYITAPMSAIVAHGVKLDREWICEEFDSKIEGKPCTEVIVVCTDHIVPMRILRELFPDWPWLRYPRQNTRIPDHIVGPFVEMMNAGKIAIKIDLTEVSA